MKIDYFLGVKKWIVENIDFKNLMTRYNKPKVVLYLDPPLFGRRPDIQIQL
ncbi:MAG: hypothetical protein M1526_02440 [Candidatus Thermoplasmatota archaeon]|nr:hypothetical protein [Candidatus Thermoplasmatota archaeon]